MSSSRAQSVGDADRDVRQFLIRIAAALGDVLPDAFTNLYVHGSLATGSFHRERSDIDLIAVVSRALMPTERANTARELVRLSGERPTPGDIEVNVIQECHARNFTHPLPYELHYSNGYREAFRRGSFDFTAQRTGVDLAVHLAEVRERGVTLVGPPPAWFFGPVPWHAYISALHEDFDWAAARIAEQPEYAILNACRILHGTTNTTMSVLNKDEAAQWAFESVPAAHHAVIRDALSVYRGVKSRQDVVFPGAAIEALRGYVYERSKRAFDRAADSEEDE